MVEILRGVNRPRDLSLLPLWDFEPAEGKIAPVERF
jgi:hypothetical protein